MGGFVMERSIGAGGLRPGWGVARKCPAIIEEWDGGTRMPLL